MGKAGTTRVIKIKDADGNDISINEGAVIYAQANLTTPLYTDITLLAGAHRKHKATYQRSMAGILASTENLISVTIDSVATLINVNRIEKMFSADNTLSGVCHIMYDLDGMASKKLICSDTLQEVNEKIWAVGDVASSNS